MKKISIPLISILSSLVLFSACGESTTTEKIVEVAVGGTEIVESVKDLPKCIKDNQGERVWVKEESADRVCVDGNWFATVAKDSSADFSCTTKELKDKSGLKIVCNGDSIGVVLNGSAGKDGEKGDTGEKGEDGIGCSIAAQTDSLVTVKCGDKSMTLNLRANGVTVDTTSVDTLKLDSEKVAISLDSLSGYSQKGPFLKGSTVYLYELSDGRTLKQTNGNFTSEIKDDDGRYKFTSRNLVSQYALLVADGKYHNEVTGKPTNTAIKLQAYTNMLSRRSANVNLLTHLEKDRVFYLVTQEKKTVRAAKKQAQAEILAAFHIDASSMKAESEDLDVFGKTDADAALLAISVLLQGEGDETDLSVLLTEMADDLAEDGDWGNAAKRAEIADWAASVDSTVMDTASKLVKIRKNVQGWGLGGGNVPDFEKFIRKFWSKELGLGVCGEGENKVGTVKNVSNTNSQKFYAEKYFNENGAGNKVRFICDDASLYRWRAATDLEKDRFNWNPKNTKMGELLDGPFTGKKMVFDKDTLRYANSTEVGWNRGCVNYLNDSSIVLDGQLSHYKCTAGEWKFDIKGSSGSMKDKAGVEYRTITIGNQVWMAENLNYEVEGQSVCFDNLADNCAKYGRLYTWAAAVGKTEGECGYGKTCELPDTVRGVCPEGWHLPSKAEWETLFDAVGERLIAGDLLKSQTGWYGDINGKDEFGFTALPVGYMTGKDSFGEKENARFWSASRGNGSDGWYGVGVDLYYSNETPFLNDYNKNFRYSVRCLQD